MFKKKDARDGDTDWKWGKDEVSEIQNDLALVAVVIKESIIGEVMSELVVRDWPRKSKKQKVPEIGNNYKGPGGNKPGVLKKQMRGFL